MGFSMDKVEGSLIEAASQYSDWHIDIDKPATSVMFTRSAEDRGDGAVPCLIPIALRPFVVELERMLKEHEEANGPHAFNLDITEKFRFRGERIRPRRYALRRIRNDVVPLPELGLGDDAVKVLMDPEFRSGGLILIAGETGAGKSTTAASVVVARLKAFGGYCLTVESPIECVFEGFHGKGFVEQVDASITGFKYEVSSAMRKFPAETRSMFFFGEVLEEVAAAELARLIGRGHLVITTIHAKDIVPAVEMIVAFAERGGEIYARQLIGGNLRAIMHQRLQNGKPIVKCYKATETMRNIIANPNAPLANINNEFDLAHRQQAQRRTAGRL